MEAFTRFKRVGLIQVAVIAAASAGWAIASSDGYDYPWKDGNSFGIHRLVGMKEAFKPGERIHLKVLCCPTTTDVSPEPRNGFNVQAYVDDLSLQRSLVGVNGAWQESLQCWTVDLPAPLKRGVNYRLLVGLYCSNDDSLCAETYGRAAQAIETCYFDVR